MAILGGDEGSGRDAEAFWNDTEAKIGESVVAFGLAQYLSGGGEEGPLWGLVYLTETRLFFRHFPQTGWFQAITNASTNETGERRKRPKERDITLVWSLTQFSDIRLPAPQSRWRRILFGNTSPTVTLMWEPIAADASSAPDPLVFTVENNDKTFLAALERAIGYPRVAVDPPGVSSEAWACLPNVPAHPTVRLLHSRKAVLRLLQVVFSRPQYDRRELGTIGSIRIVLTLETQSLPTAESFTKAPRFAGKVVAAVKVDRRVAGAYRHTAPRVVGANVRGVPQLRGSGNVGREIAVSRRRVRVVESVRVVISAFSGTVQRGDIPANRLPPREIERTVGDPHNSSGWK